MAAFGMGSAGVGRRVRKHCSRSGRTEAPDVASLTARPLTSYDPYFIQIEFDAIQSEARLGKAVENLMRSKAWVERHPDSRRLSGTNAAKLLKGNWNATS